MSHDIECRCQYSLSARTHMLGSDNRLVGFILVMCFVGVDFANCVDGLNVPACVL